MSDAAHVRSGPPDRRRLRAGLAIAVAIGVAAGLVVAFATGGGAVLDAASGLPLLWLVAALGLSALSWVFQGVGLAALSPRGQRHDVAGMTAAFLGGDFAALVTPFGSGGIPASVFCLMREGLSAGESSAIVAVHGLLTALSFLIMAVIAALALPARTAVTGALAWSMVAILVTAVAAVVWLAVRPSSATGWLERTLARRWASRLLGPEKAQRASRLLEREARRFALDVVTLTREKPVRLLVSFAGVFASRACLIACLPVIMHGLGWRGPLLPVLATGVGAMALSVVSPTPGGSGAVEGGTAILLVAQAPAALAGAATLLWRGVTYYSEMLVGWIVFTAYLAKRPNPRVR